ncbi:quercetin 2,3-dioxygenase [Planococcus sp. N028]|uniref:Quercetin 2,3-dioxygenase n=1 Tax=Planococcus shixiaomingii TaxID=3058393 RepID=A0ABT8N496_9BACL|nr:quercetin 2,3-dioxygenase [Planococcus sp. N028]MDN7242713.1 quercetin 2,3-dioxygenase [Planococcus sp. N028]
MKSQVSQCYTLSVGEGKAYWFMGTFFEVKATAKETNGVFSLIEELNPPGEGPPLHVHHNEDETFYVLAGNVTFQIGEKTFYAAAGSYVFAPRDTPHTYRVEGEAPARFLTMMAPPGIEQLFIELGTPALERTLPPDTITTDIEKMYMLAKEYNAEILE